MEDQPIKKKADSALSAERNAALYEQRCKEIIPAYRIRLLQRGHGSLEQLCRHYNVPLDFFRQWLKQQDKTITDVVCETKEELLAAQSNDVVMDKSDYESVLLNYKKCLMSTPRLTLFQFCKKHDITYVNLMSWMRHHRITVAELKIAAGVQFKKENMNEMPSSHFFGRVLNNYKKVLEDQPNYSFRKHCRESKADYEAMIKWMYRIGVQIKQLKQAVVIEQKVPRHPRPVFVQFKPNGGTNGDRLTGVKIQLADGSNIEVKECTVISLCAFITQFNEQQKSRKDK